MGHFIELLVLLCVLKCSPVEPHGRLIEPPSRSSMWRYGFHSRPNYNDHELYCGGYSRQWQKNDGKCGICGDPWDSNLPRDNEAGGMYGQGIIARKYMKGDTIKIRIQLTANHMGYFEFRLCPNNQKSQAASQRCLDQYVLRKRNAPGTKYYPGPGAKIFEMIYRLPSDLTCTQCVLQWKYVAGNNWGKCPNGTGAVGCGPQEEFRACSDISITELDGSADDKVNDLMDPESYVPTHSPPNPTTTPLSPPTSEISFVDINDLDEDISYEDRLGKPLHWESILLIILASMLFTGLFFCSIFFYFLKVKDFVQNFYKRRDLSLPLPKGGGECLTSPSSISKQLRTLLQRAAFWKKPLMIEEEGHSSPKKKKVTISSELPTVYTNDPQETDSTTSSSEGPIPPPRTKKVASSVSPRLATINSRGPVQRPSLPPPSVPPKEEAASPPPILRISHPTSVTINGVSVPRNVSPCGEGVIAQARFALANDDIPDSSVESSSIPPPLPTTEPPELDQE